MQVAKVGLKFMIGISCSHLMLRTDSSLPTYKITKGTVAKLRQIPSLVVILDKGKHLCSGNIINPKVIVTTNLCIMAAKSEAGINSELQVMAGDITYLHVNQSKHRTYESVDKIISHPLFNEQTHQHDICLIVLQNEIIFLSTIIPAQITFKEYPVGTKCVVAGWGSTDPYNSSLSKTLLKTTVVIKNNTACKKFHKKMFFEMLMLCAGDTSRANLTRDACMGDLGSGLYCDQDLVGIVAIETSCGVRGTPGAFYTKLSTYQQWIEKTLDSLDKQKQRAQSGNSLNRCSMYVIFMCFAMHFLL